MKDILSYYHREEGKILIEVKTKSAMRLFNTLDPSPLEEKELDADTAEYIADSAREVGRKRGIKLVLYLPEEGVWKEDPEALVHAVHNHFEYRRLATKEELRRFLRRGWRNLLTGISFLFLCTTAGELLSRAFSGTFYDIAAEGLVIGGWVAMWRPIETFLYNWRPLARSVRLYERLSTMEVEAKPAG